MNDYTDPTFEAITIIIEATALPLLIRAIERDFGPTEIRYYYGDQRQPILFCQGTPVRTYPTDTGYAAELTMFQDHDPA